MAIKMSKEEIETTIRTMKDRNNMVPDAHYDRVIERMCNYIEANVDEFMDCYSDYE